MVQAIPLANDRGTAFVDDADAGLVAGYTWCLHAARPNGGTVDYAIAYVPGTGHRGQLILMHVLLMGQAGVDHRDGNGLNNTRSNLRLATRAQNAANSRPRGGSSAYKGVCLTRWGWQAYITADKRRIHLGYYTDEVAAAMVYDHAARQAYGAFARLNFPHSTTA